MPSSFTLPITFAHVSQLPQNDATNCHSLISDSCVASTPSAIVSWTLENEQRAVALGCRDGSIFVFGPQNSKESGNERAEKRAGSGSLSSPSTLRGSHPTSRSTSPSGSSIISQPPFSISSRSRVVSGITAAAIEAPKNYVDFDDEPSKLKEMLKGRPPKDRSSHGPTVDVVAPDVRVDDIHRSGRKVSASLKSPGSPAPPSPVPTPTSTSKGLGLRYHIVPRLSGAGHAVSGILLVGSSRILVSLHEQGDIYAFATQDGRCLSSIKATAPFLESVHSKPEDIPQQTWVWQSLRTIQYGESTLLVATSVIDSTAPSTSFEDSAGAEANKCRVVVLEIQTTERSGSFDAAFVKLGDWIENGTTHVDIADNLGEDSLFIYVVDENGQLIIKSLRIVENYEITTSTPESSDGDTRLNLPNPFKALRSRSTEHLIQEEHESSGRRVIVHEGIQAGVLKKPDRTGFGLRLHITGTSTRGLLWTTKEVQTFELSDDNINTVYTESASGLLDAQWVDHESYILIFDDRFVLYGYHLVDGDNNHLRASPSEGIMQPYQLHSTPLPPFQKAFSLSRTGLLVYTNDKAKGVRFQVISAQTTSATTIWQTSHFTTPRKVTTYLTATLPLDQESAVLGYSDGLIRQASWTHMSGESAKERFDKVSDVALDGYIASLFLVENLRTKERFVVGGADDGSLAVWALDSLKLCARWTIFTTSLLNVLRFPHDRGVLGGCILCVAEDGTIAVVVVDGLQFLYMIPGAPATLERMCLGEDNFLLYYANHMVRLWDVKTKEFWRSMTAGKADELMEEGGWAQLFADDLNHPPHPTLRRFASRSRSLDFTSTLLFDVDHFLSISNSVTRSISTGLEQTRAIYSTLDRLRAMLSILLTWGVSQDIDTICRTQLAISSSVSSHGIISRESVVLFASAAPIDLWCISGVVSATRCIAIAATLRALALHEEYADTANTIVTFYTTSLASAVGSRFQPPDLPLLASKSLFGSSEIRHAAKLVFDATIMQLLEGDTIKLCDDWHRFLPVSSSTLENEETSALALFLCGHSAAGQHSLLPESVLTDIAKSIFLYMHAEDPIRRALAIDLCSRGFQIWQHYVDAMEMLRALFTLSTTSRKDSINVHNTAAQARAAVLSIASSNTPLFMTTLALDILNPSNLEYRKSVMQMVAFLIRKRPLVLYPNLPRLMEAVVKSLDPNSTSHRDAVLDTATQIIGDVVKTFPTVDFHMGSQRLAVGTSEGAIVMYDLKTAIRLYVLEGHKKRLAACSFSPDGRRLVSVSLEENVVLVWKVGSSFSSFFNPGAPPRQGHGGSEPYKTLPFNVGQEANMTIAATLEWVRFNWISDRSVKLDIRESVLTFST
ncbi:WD40-repeat-containing domain superfamily protein [Pleurotus pulmonarius]